MKMIRFKIFVFVLLIFCGCEISDVVSQLFRPFVYPATHDTVVTPPRDLTLGCEGNGIEHNITWTLPDNSEFWTSTNFDRRVLNENGEEEVLPKFITRTTDNINITYMNITDSTDHTKINAAALLILKNVTYADLGNYYCHGIGVPIDDEDRVNKIFVFVKDPERLAFLQKDKYYTINERKSTENVTFPCIPTAPNTTVILKAFSSSRSSDTYTEISSEIATYDHQLGYSLKISETNFDKFICEFITNTTREQVYFNVRFDNFSDYNVKPYINYTISNLTTDFIDLYGGNNLELYCTIATDSENTSTVVWVIPNKSRVNVEIINRTIPMYNGQLHVAILNIKNLTENDAGEYICKINDTAINGHVAKKFVTVDIDLYEPQKPEISVTSDSKYYRIYSGQDLILSCKGKKKLTWSIPSYTEANSLVEMDDIKSSVEYVRDLKIINASYYNTGYYYCHAENYQKNDPNFASEIFVYVEDDDNLNSNPNEVFSTKAAQYSIVTIPCIPTSPDVNVSLIDTLTLQKRPEKHIPFKGFDLYVPVDDIENLECKFENDDRLEIQKIIIDVERTYRYEYMPLLTPANNVYSFTGGDLILYCSVIVNPDFFPNISWATPSQPEFLANLTLNTTEASYMVSNGKLVVNTLTISNVGLGDTREYECSILDNKNKTRYDRKLLDLNIAFDIKPFIQVERHLAVGETLEANCTVRADHNIRFEMKWEIPGDLNDNRTSVTDTQVFIDVYGRLGNNTLSIKNITFNDVGNYTCKVRDHKNNTNEETVFINIQTPNYPTIVESNLKNESKTISAGTSFDMLCKISLTDIPKPSISWYKNEDLITDNGTEEIGFSFSQINDSGLYSCNVTSRLGMISNWINLEVISDDLQFSTPIFIAVIAILLISFFILTTVFGIRMLRERRLQRKLKSAGLVDFEEGQVQNLNPNYLISDQAELLPYDKKWEIAKERIKIGKQLGSGQFGVVMKGDVFGVFVGETIKTVAIKMVHRNADYQSIKALVNELKIMTYIGKHLNVVNLLGACTANIKKREILIITEYCINGNIRNHLLAHRDLFVNQIDPETGLIDIDNIDPSLYKKVIPSEDELSKCMNPYKNLDDKSVKFRKCSKGYYRKIKGAQKREYANLTNENKPKFVSTHDLLCWSFQVARGMDYLATRRILHGDLAARNVLLSDSNIVKICDFGLAKNMYKYKNYKKKTKTPLPVKWMAIESIRDRIFSAQSDVWSFGVTLWEMFTLAIIPYPDREPDASFVKDLENGLRMDQPEYATSDIYHIMMKCWDETPSNRPTFPTLVELLGSMVHENVRKHYIELNKPYENLNIAEGAPNYLEVEDVEKKKSNTEMETKRSDENGEKSTNMELETEAVKSDENDENSESKEFEIKTAKSDKNDENVDSKESEATKFDENNENSELTERIRTSCSESQVRKRFKSIVDVEVHPAPE